MKEDYIENNSKLENEVSEKRIHLGMIGGHEFMTQFIKKLKTGELKIETAPQVEICEKLTSEYIIEQLESYQELLDSNIIEEATKEETLVKALNHRITRKFRRIR